MNATVNIICYKQKTLKNGEHPLMIRVAKDGKRKLKSLDLSKKKFYIQFSRDIFIFSYLCSGINFTDNPSKIPANPSQFLIIFNYQKVMGGLILNHF